MPLALLFTHTVYAQDTITNLNSVTGTYRAALDSTLYFNVNIANSHLVLEVPGKGTTKMLPQGGLKYKPEYVQPATVVEFIPGSHAFHWFQDQNMDMVRLAGSKGYSGKYKPANNPYLIVDVREKGNELIIQQGASQPLTMQAMGKDHFEYRDDRFCLRYDFIRDAADTVQAIRISRTGPQLFVKQAQPLALSYGGRDFSKRTNFNRADSLQGYLSPERSCYDVLFYALDVQILPELQTVAGHNTIRFKAIKPFRSMQVDLFASMRIDSILYHHQPLRFRREYNAVFIELPQTLPTGTIDSLTIHYAGQPRQPELSKWQGGFFWLRDKNGNPLIQSVCQGSGASLWWPCKDHLSDEPDSMRIAVTVPDTLTEISNGTLIGMTPQPDGWMRYEWYVHYPINVYNVVVNLGKFDHYSEKYVNGKDTMPLHFYYLDYHKELAKAIFGHVQPMLRLFEKYFGPYPFYKDGFTIMESIYPMEHQGAVSVGLFNSPFYSDQCDTAGIIRLAWHEAAHEWWGNSVSCKDNADIWFHEAFATYAELLGLETFKGRDAMLHYLREQKPENRLPLIGSYDVNDFHLDDVYSKGSKLVYMLRKIIDDDTKWQALLKGIQQHFKYKTIGSAELEAYIIRFTRLNLKPVFDQYLRHTALPELVLKKDGITWKADVPNFSLPVKTDRVDTDAYLIRVQKE